MRPEQRITATLATFSIDRSNMPASQIIAVTKSTKTAKTWTLILRGIDALKRATREISGGRSRIYDLQEIRYFLKDEPHNDHNAAALTLVSHSRPELQRS